MKKLFALVISVAILAAFLPTTFATDICAAEPLTVRNFNAEITSAVHLRTVSCMQESTVITTLSGGEIVQVIGTTEGWHKVRRADGTEGWIWETFLTETSKPFNPSEPEPEPEPEPYVEPEPVEYVAMRDIGGHKYEDAIWYVYNNEIVQGYEDGSYKPDQTINRAELLKIIIEAKYNNEFEAYDSQGCFTDVAASQWYSKYVCFALSKYIVEGYKDGSFKPANEINFVEALKLALIGFGIGYEEGDPWYRKIVEEASEANLIPLDVDKFDDILTRGQIAEMITRIMKYEDETLADYLGAMVDSKITYEMLEY
ncbi:S-layer homology domain-containing protein [Patescibacteria group bacterium]